MKQKFKNWVAKNSEMLEKDFIEEFKGGFEAFCAMQWVEREEEYEK